jgi:hypothetical protein
MKNGKKHSTQNFAATGPPETGRKGVCDSIRMDYIENQLMELPVELAWEIFQRLNELLQENEVWRRHDIGIRNMLKDRMRQKELNQKRINVFAHAGSTANVGCEITRPEFKLISDKGLKERN